MLFRNKRQADYQALLQRQLLVEAALSFQILKSNDALLEEISNQVSGQDELKNLFFELQQAAVISTYSHVWTIKEELDYPERYLAIWEKVKGTSFQLVWKASIFDPKQTVFPLITLALLENAIIHGYHAMAEHPVKIRLTTSKNQLQLEVSNRVNHHLVNQAETIELNLFKQRLACHYPDKHQLFINSNSNLYKTTLFIDLSS